MDVYCESLEAAGASMRPSGSSPAARPPLRHRRRPALAGEGPSLARPTPSLASPPLAGEAHALASEGPSPARVKALAGEAPRQRGPSPRWRGCPRQRGPRPRQRERVRFLMQGFHKEKSRSITKKWVDYSNEPNAFPRSKQVFTTKFKLRK